MWRRKRALKGLDDDIRDHIARETEENVARGMTPDEARRRAFLNFGNVSLAIEDTRAVWAWRWLTELLQDLRYATRTLRKSPWFAVTAILTLALGVGASTAIFSVADAAVFRPALYPNPERIVRLYLEPHVKSARGFSVNGRQAAEPSAADFTLWQTVSRHFESVATWSSGSVTLSGQSVEVKTFKTRAISDGYLRVYGIQPILGRPFTPEDQQLSAPVVLLGYNFWRDHLGRDPAVLGTILRFDEGALTVVGVLPPSLAPAVAIWRPLGLAAINPPKPAGVSVVARLRPGVSLADAEATLAAITPAESPMRPQPGSVRPFPVPDVRASEPRLVWTLLGAVSCVLLIACVNVAGLQLARGASRRHELATRAALGAGRLRLIRLLFAESVVLASIGGTLGVGLAWLGLDALLAVLPLEFSLRAVTINPVVLTFAVAVSVLSGLAFGLLPAVRLSAAGRRLEPDRAGMGQRTTTSSPRTGHVLIGVETALALVLLVGSSLMIRTLVAIHAVDLGFDPTRFVALDVEFRDRPTWQLLDPLLSRVRELPGFASVGAVSMLPLGNESARGAQLAHLDGSPTNKPEKGWDIRLFVPGYFETIGMRRVAGQWPSAADCASPAPPLVVNESAARRLFTPGTAAGQAILARGLRRQIVAVGSDMRHSGPEVDAVSEIYFCRNDSAAGETPAVHTIVVRPERGANTRELLRAAVLSLGERVTDIQIRSGEDLFADITATPRHRTILLTLLGVLGLGLAVVGVFGMTAYAVARRTREIGIRMAFGARPVDAVLAIVRDAARPGAIGLGLGLLVAYLSAPVLSAFLFQTAPRDPLAFASAAAALAVAGLLAAWIPARRAARVNPVEALRAE